ncbi:major tail protein [Gordonia phage Trine]|uniref:Major tail protein n=1 Tax=Gordonia phage Trine TaxID=2201431 RepID=A0A2Z4QA89_9CAUD|nr:major tail protein [Gordonia phage Trine]AWY06513.1 major tail protein [Gordonia phage Trine]
MAGNPNNVKIWEDADVRILKPSAIVAPATISTLIPGDVDAEWGPEWLLAGLLDGSEGFGESREWDESEHTAWGYGLIKVSSRNFKMTRTFTALEANEVTDYLYSPGDTAGKVIIAKPAYVYLGFETIADDGTKERLITTVPARVTAPESNRNEEDLASRQFTANIFPNSDKELFHRQVSAA